MEYASCGNFVFVKMLYLQISLLNKANLANKGYCQVTIQQSQANERKIPGLLDKTSLSVLHRLGKLISFNFLSEKLCHRI